MQEMATTQRFIDSPQRRWLDLLVGTVLISMLVFGSRFIYQLNNDARDLELSSELARRGQQLSTDHGCVACHTVDGSPGVGPTWQGMWGKTELLTTGEQVRVDAEYFARSLRESQRQVLSGYPNVMPYYFLPAEDVQALVEYARQLSPLP
jgi:mono/diheme cytochrome c family protein